MNKLLGVLSLIWKVYVGILFVVMALLFFPFIYPLLFSERNRKRAFRVFVVWSWTFRIICFYHVKKVRKAELPDGPYVILANHISYLDIFLMYSILPQNEFLFLGKGELLKYPIIGAYFKTLNIPVHRGNRMKAARSIVQASREVKKGWSIVIFPEGQIPDVNPKMKHFKSGAFQLAKNLNLPIVPMTFTNNHILFSDPTFILGPARPGICKVYMHDYISAEKVAGMEQKELRAYCYELLNGPLLEQYPELRKK
jgi:1-acyl-sn-glycerol-3-phosphate acyltransferase